MDHLGSGENVLARFASSFVNGVKRTFTEIGTLIDSRAYKEEVVRYEGELRQNTGCENEREQGIDAGARKPATS